MCLSCNVIILNLNDSSQGSDSGFKYFNTPSQGSDTELNIWIPPAKAVALIYILKSLLSAL